MFVVSHKNLLVKERALLDYAAVHAQLKEKGVTRLLLWEEYRAAHPDSGYSYAQFCFPLPAVAGAAAGLRLIERGAHLPTDATDDLHLVDHVMLRQLRPEPRVGWGIVLGQERLATAMIDISDGLSSDLNHLCSESETGALIDSSLIPIDQKVADLCGRRALDPLQLALHGGEDFELLFTVHPENVSRLPRRVDGVAITRIGEIGNAVEGTKISEGSRVWELEPGGWRHF